MLIGLGSSTWAAEASADCARSVPKHSRDLLPKRGAVIRRMERQEGGGGRIGLQRGSACNVGVRGTSGAGGRQLGGGEAARFSTLWMWTEWWQTVCAVVFGSQIRSSEPAATHGQHCNFVLNNLNKARKIFHVPPTIWTQTETWILKKTRKLNTKTTTTNLQLITIKIKPPLSGRSRNQINRSPIRRKGRKWNTFHFKSAQNKRTR